MDLRKRFTAAALAASLVMALGVFAGVSAAPQKAVSKRVLALSLEEARKIALKRVPGTVEDEFSLEDDDGNVTSYIFVIKDSKKKVWEVQIGSAKGNIESVEEQESDDEDSEDPPESEDPPPFHAGGSQL